MLISCLFDFISKKKAVAQVSLTSLRKTFKYGGRRNVPSQIELDALIVSLIWNILIFNLDRVEFCVINLENTI